MGNILTDDSGPDQVAAITDRISTLEAKIAKVIAGSAPTGTSANGTVVAFVGQWPPIFDSQGNIWGLAAGGMVALNGVADTTTSGVAQVLYWNTAIYWQNASGLWFEKASASQPSWSGPMADPRPTPTPTPTPSPTPSPTPTLVVLKPGSTATIKDTAGNVWNLTANGAAYINGQPAPGGGGTDELTVYKGVIWGRSANNKSWWTYANGSWLPQSAPPPGLPAGD